MGLAGGCEPRLSKKGASSVGEYAAAGGHEGVALSVGCFSTCQRFRVDRRSYLGGTLALTAVPATAALRGAGLAAVMKAASAPAVPTVSSFAGNGMSGAATAGPTTSNSIGTTQGGLAVDAHGDTYFEDDKKHFV